MVFGFVWWVQVEGYNVSTGSLHECGPIARSGSDLNDRRMLYESTDSFSVRDGPSIFVDAVLANGEGVHKATRIAAILPRSFSSGRPKEFL
jgi:hypothetical protein